MTDPWERLRNYLSPYAWRCLYAVAAMCLVAAFNGASVLVLKPIVDKILIAKDFRMLGLAVVGVPLLMALKTAASYVQNYLMSWLGQRVTQDIREDLFRRLHALPLSYYADHEAGEILSRATGDLVVMQWALTSMPLYLIRDSMTLLTLLACLFYLNWPFALLSLLGLPLASAVLYVLSRKMRAASLQSQAVMARLYQRFQESVRGMAAIRAFNYEEATIEKFQEENAEFLAPTMSYLRATALSAPLMEFCAGTIAALILYFGGCEVILNRMTPGAFFAFLGAYFAAYAPVKNLARSNSELQRALAAAERIFQLLDAAPAPRRAPRPAPGPAAGVSRPGPDLSELRLEALSFRYPRRSEFVLRGLDCAVHRGERLSILGPSGAGKTTLAQLLLRLHEPTEGRILVDGRDARELDARQLRSRIGLIARETLLFNETVFENVTLGRKVSTLGEVERACQKAGVAEFIERLPGGYRTRLGESGHSLPWAQRQKLAVARVLLKDPPLLILDEAAAGLDRAGEADILRLLEELGVGRTIIALGAKPSGLPKTDRVLSLSQGSLAEVAGAS